MNINQEQKRLHQENTKLKIHLNESRKKIEVLENQLGQDNSHIKDWLIPREIIIVEEVDTVSIDEITSVSEEENEVIEVVI